MNTRSRGIKVDAQLHQCHIEVDHKSWQIEARQKLVWSTDSKSVYE